MSDTVPAKAVKFDLAAAGLGEKRISFQGRDDDPEVVKAKIEDTFPQLKDTGGFELLRISEWKCEQDATRAAWLYKSKLLSKYETRKAVVLQMDLRESIVDQQTSLISLYKAPKVEWAGPVSCKLEGDVAVGEGVKRFFFSKAVSLVQSGLHLNFDLTRLFDGEPEHLTPSTSQTLLESDMFLVAGRIMGHSFIHGGPCVSGHNTNKPSSQAAEEMA
uniref:uncharacterized protein LOC112434812 n=1 Tax=Maylandia zebra TaxID=106582 RepID=UPI000D30735D|nr:uncharacterized protein LOC112434812 [Maylandia zebra]